MFSAAELPYFNWRPFPSGEKRALNPDARLVGNFRALVKIHRLQNLQASHTNTWTYTHIRIALCLLCLPPSFSSHSGPSVGRTSILHAQRFPQSMCMSYEGMSECVCECVCGIKEDTLSSTHVSTDEYL